jgi:hypothetical protein
VFGRGGGRQTGKNVAENHWIVRKNTKQDNNPHILVGKTTKKAKDC